MGGQPAVLAFIGHQLAGVLVFTMRVEFIQAVSAHEAKPLLPSAFSPFERAGFKALGIRLVMRLYVIAAEP